MFGDGEAPTEDGEAAVVTPLNAAGERAA